MLGLSGSYQEADFHWSIAGNSAGQNPNVLSEIKWKKLRAIGFGADIQWNICSNIFLKGNYYAENIRSGRVGDTDYAQDNRTYPVYQAMLNGSQGRLSRLMFAPGYSFRLNSRFSLDPYAGFSASRQQLHLTRFPGETTADEMALNSRYYTRWTGAAAGAAANFTCSPVLQLTAVLEYQQLRYHADADWNLIDAFAHPLSFRHRASGYAAAACLQLNWKLCPALFLNIQGNYRYGETGKGTDVLYLADGQQQQAQLNGVFSHSAGASLGLRYTL